MVEKTALKGYFFSQSLLAKKREEETIKIIRYACYRKILVRIVFFVSILLVSSCLSAKKKVGLHNKNTTLPVRGIASSNNSSFGDWLGKICAFSARQAAYIFETALYPTKALKVFEDNDYLIVRTSVRIGDGRYYTRDFAVRECQNNQTTYMTAQNFIKWLEEAKICRLDDAKKLFTVFTKEKPISPIGKETPIQIIGERRDQHFHYLSTSSGKIYRIGRQNNEECSTVSLSSD